jgi:hypothetical protein
MAPVARVVLALAVVAAAISFPVVQQPMAPGLAVAAADEAIRTTGVVPAAMAL